MKHFADSVNLLGVLFKLASKDVGGGRDGIRKKSRNQYGLEGGRKKEGN